MSLHMTLWNLAEILWYINIMPLSCLQFIKSVHMTAAALSASSSMHWALKGLPPEQPDWHDQLVPGVWNSCSEHISYCSIAKLKIHLACVGNGRLQMSINCICPISMFICTKCHLLLFPLGSSYLVVEMLTIFMSK